MPQIPVYRQQVRQAPAADTRLGLRATPDAFGAPIAEGVQALGGAVAKASKVYDQIAAEETARANEAQMAQAQAAATKASNDLGLAYQTHKLGEAVKQRDTYKKKYGESLDEIAKSLGNETQRQAFANLRAKQEVAFGSFVDGHAYAESEKSFDLDFQTASAEIRRSIRINADPNNGPEGLDQVRNRLESLAVINAGYGKRKGLNEQQIAELNRSDVADAHAVVINTWNDAGHSVAAKAYFEQHKDELEPKARDLLGKALELGVTKAVGQSQAESIWSPDKTLEAMFAEADQIEDQQVQAETKRRLDEKRTLHLRAIEQVRDAAFDASYEKAKASPLGIDALSASELTALGPDREQKLRSWNLRRMKDQPLPWQASKAVRYGLEQEAGDPRKRDAFAKLNLTDYIDRLNEDDFNALSSLQKDIRSGKSDGADWLNTREDLVNQAMASIGLDPRPYVTERGKTTLNPQSVAFRSSVEKEAARIATSNKRETPSPEDVQQAVDTITKRRVRLNQWGRDPDRVAASLTADERKQAYVPIDLIPANYDSQIRSEIRRATGNDATDDQVQRAFAAIQTSDKSLYDSIIAGQ